MARRDSLTMELPGLKRRVGRPSTGKAKTGAQRQAAYMARKKAEFSSPVTEIRVSAAAGGFEGFSNDGSSTTVIKSHK